MSKKARTLLEIIVSLIPTLLLFFALLALTANCIRVSSQALQAFYSFSDNLNQFADDTELNKRAYNIIMDEETSMIGFVSNTESLNLNTKEGSNVKKYAFFKKPLTCDKEKACICLCRSSLKTKDSNPIELYCDSLKCAPNFDKFDFNKTIESKDLEGNEFVLEGGFIISRKKSQSRLTDVLLKKNINNGKKIITVCKDEDCTLNI